MEQELQEAMDLWYFTKGQWQGTDVLKWEAASRAWKKLRLAEERYKRTYHENVI